MAPRPRTAILAIAAVVAGVALGVLAHGTVDHGSAWGSPSALTSTERLGWPPAALPNEPDASSWAKKAARPSFPLVALAATSVWFLFGLAVSRVSIGCDHLPAPGQGREISARGPPVPTA